jgi:transcriptional antiterminator RfaH
MWYLIHCEAQRDQQVERLVAHAGMETFAARIPKTRKRNGDKALFPGYVFVRLDPHAGSWSMIRYLPGVRSLVEIGGGPCPVADEIVEAIRERVAILLDIMWRQVRVEPSVDSVRLIRVRDQLAGEPHRTPESS